MTSEIIFQTSIDRQSSRAATTLAMLLKRSGPLWVKRNTDARLWLRPYALLEIDRPAKWRQYQTERRTYGSMSQRCSIGFRRAPALQLDRSSGETSSRAISIQMYRTT